MADDPGNHAGARAPAAQPTGAAHPPELLACAAGSREEVTSELQPLTGVAQGSQAALVVISGGDVGRFHRLPGLFRIGRGSDADLHASGPGVSRRHAEIELQADGTFVLRDLGSHNGTLVNGRRVVSHSLRFGDQIDVGGETRLRFVYRDEVDMHLQEAQRLEAVGQLAGGIAHEFNNLLAVVLGNLAVLRDAVAGRELRTSVDDCITAARRGADLTRDLLSFARRSGVSRQPVDVAELLREVTTVLRDTFDRDIAVGCDCPAGLMVTGDAARLQQVLLNITVNARDAMPTGGSFTIIVDRVERESVEGLFGSDASAAHYVRIKLRDTGHGMDAATRARIFEPFFTTKEVGQGTGLGLALAHGIVGSHHGTITVESAPGRGTTFTILLPEAGDEPAARPEPRRRPTPDRSPRGDERAATEGARRATVLVLDDEPGIRRLVEHILTASGFEVLLAADGEGGLELLRRAPGNIAHVLLDINMPGLDGERVFHALLAVDPHLHVVVCSGNGEDPRVRRLRAAPGVSWLPKPFDPAALLAAVTPTAAGG